jgi:hypothetical protein
MYKEIQKWVVAKPYMTNCLLKYDHILYVRISSYIMKPFLIYDLQQLQSEFPDIWGKIYFIFYQCTVYTVHVPSFNNAEPSKISCVELYERNKF